MNDLDALLKVAIVAAARGAAVLESLFLHVRGERLPTETKASALDLVTAADRASEDEVVAALRETGVAIVAEEGTGGRAPRRGEPVWYVDPLDGTTNYAFGHPFHCVSIGLLINGEPVLGVVHAPALGLVFQGSAASGGERVDLRRAERRSLRVSPFERIEDVLVATGFPYDRRTSSDDNLAAHGAIMKRAQGVMRCGSAALDLCLVADGTYGGFWERKLKPWDLCAGAALVRAAGGTLSHFDHSDRAPNSQGGPPDILSGAIVASNGHVHAELLALLAPHLPPTPRS
jgi:myo-inositol-1(or 4)-monophosphatase